MSLQKSTIAVFLFGLFAGVAGGSAYTAAEMHDRAAASWDCCRPR